MVKCDIRGQVFYALVTAKDKRLDIQPIDSRVTYRSVTAREVIGHYRKAKGSK